MPYCPSCGSKSLYYIHGLSTPRAENNARQLVYFCNAEGCKHFVVVQKIESGNANIPATVRSTVIKPLGKARDSANKILAKYSGKVL
ncbi:MAG: hypothetical protein HMLIMOIP_001792 [Candidatus Nitrosomirales archaeon]|jgi:hypothetical protein